MKLALGTAQFGSTYGIANHSGQVTRSAAKNMLLLAQHHNIDTLDTAIAYGDSESCLGVVGTEGLKIITKLPAVPDGCDNTKRWISKQISESFTRLGVTSVYGLLLHSPNQLLSHEGESIFNALQELKEYGLVQKIGVSIYSPRELELLVPSYKFDLVQAPFNLVDRRLFTSGWLHRLKEDGVELHTRSAFLQGLLLMPRSEIPLKFMRWKELWNCWDNWLKQNNFSAVQACLAYPMMFQEVDRVVVGADSLYQLSQIIDGLRGVEIFSFPDLNCEDEELINPVNWSML
jgi:aryl-alcohol dehydrogenase-like predicted oxidoreductase